MILKPKDRQAAGKEGFRSLDEYVRDLKAKGYKVAWSKILNLGETPLENVHEVMGLTAAQNRYVKRPATHFIISFSPGERPPQPTCIAIVEQSMEWLGLGDHQALIVADDEKGHFHLHCMVNIVHPYTHKASRFRDDGWKIRRCIAVASQIEKQFDLERVPRPGWTEEKILRELTGRKPEAESKTEQEKEPENEPTDRNIEAKLHREISDVGEALRSLLKRKPNTFKSWAELHAYFVKCGVHYRASGSGAAMGTEGHETRASKVDRDWSLAQLTKRLGNPPEPLRLGVELPQRTKPKRKEFPPVDKAPLLEVTAKLDASGILIQKIAEDGNKRRMSIPAEELPAMIPALARAADKSNNVLFSPIAADRHFLPVQEMSPEQLAQLEADLTPAVVLQRDDSTFDAFVAVQKLKGDPDAESAAARQLTASLQQQYAPQAPALPSIGVLPAPGFPFRAKENERSSSKVVSFLRPVAKFCRAATATFKTLVKEWEAKLKQLAKGRGSNSAMILLQQFDMAGLPSSEMDAIYRAHLADMAERSPVKGFSADRLNHLLAQRLRDSECAESLIAQVLESGMLHINPEREDAQDKAKEIATWVNSAKVLESRPPVVAMAGEWKEITRTANERAAALQQSRANEQAR